MEKIEIEPSVSPSSEALRPLDQNLPESTPTIPKSVEITSLTSPQAVSKVYTEADTLMLERKAESILSQLRGIHPESKLTPRVTPWSFNIKCEDCNKTAHYGSIDELDNAKETYEVVLAHLTSETHKAKAARNRHGSQIQSRATVRARPFASPILFLHYVQLSSPCLITNSFSNPTARTIHEHRRKSQPPGHFEQGHSHEQKQQPQYQKKK
jgi:hypothetical protein